MHCAAAQGGCMHKALRMPCRCPLLSELTSTVSSSSHAQPCSDQAESWLTTAAHSYTGHNCPTIACPVVCETTHDLTSYASVLRPGTTSEDVDAKGVENIAKAWKARNQSGPGKVERKEVVPLRTSGDLSK